MGHRSSRERRDHIFKISPIYTLLEDLMNAVKIFYCRQSVEIKADSTIREPFNEAHTFLNANRRIVPNEIIILPPISLWQK